MRLFSGTKKSNVWKKLHVLGATKAAFCGWNQLCALPTCHFRTFKRRLVDAVQKMGRAARNLDDGQRVLSDRFALVLSLTLFTELYQQIHKDDLTYEERESQQ